LYILHVLFDSFKRATRELLASFASRAEFQIRTRLLNESSRANSIVDRALASQAELARLGSNSSPRLAVGAELNRRHIKEGVRCVACNREETNLHRFWFFPHSVETWDYLRQHAMRELRPPPADIRSPRELQNWLLEWMGSVDETEVQLGMMALYHLWLVRNDARDEALIEDPRRTARRILALSEEWRDVQNEAAVSNPRVEEHWHPPPLGWHKVNADGAFSRDDKHGGGGVIIRDHHGAPLAGASHFFPM
jgi:hypothetical protein